MENYIGMAAVIAAIILSKSERSVPVVISVYYALCMFSIHAMLGDIPNLDDIVRINKFTPAEWYVVQVSISATVVVSLLAFCKRTKIVLFYACIVALSSAYNTAGIFFSALSMEWYSHVYSLHQQFAIQLDVVVAWLASDNAISRRIKQNWTEHVRREVE